MRSTKLCMFAFACLMLCAACVARYQIPATEQQLQGTVMTAEQSYRLLYLEHKASRVNKAAMVHVDKLYEAWRSTNQMLIDAVRAGAVQMAPAKHEVQP